MKKKNKTIKIILVFILLIFSISLSYIVLNNKFSFFNNSNKEDKNKQNEDGKFDPDEEDTASSKPKLKIINLNSKTRPIGIMIDNERGAWPQAGLQDAFLIYEIIVEGGESRLFALYKDANTSMLGPDRSARHYFLDYALENDAIYTHYGFSPQAESDIKTLGVNNISGTQGDGSAFWREKVITTSWQNCFTSIKNLTDRAKTKKYRMTSDEKPLLNYSVEQLDLSVNEGSRIANKARIDYSNTHYVTYEYDATTRVYKRSMRGKPHVDRVTGAQYTFKNIIVYNVRNYPLNDGSGKGRQGLDNIGSGTGYYISNGYAIPIKWSKTSRTSKTIYTDLAGNKIKVNDGNTIIHIQPTGRNLTIE
jgi:hypothetical protein